MQCPRCGTENREGRASCWSCFAPLRPAAAVKPPKEKAQKGKQVEPMPEPLRSVGEAPPDPEPVAFEPIHAIAELAEEAPVAPTFEPEPEPETVSGTGFFLPELAEPEPEPEIRQEVALPEPPVEAEETPLVSLAPQPEDALAGPRFLGEPEVEEDLGVHEPRVFDLGETPAIEAPEEEPEPIELEPSVHEPRVFDLGEAPAVEAPEEEPAPIEFEPSVHEPKVFDLREVPVVEALEEEPTSEPETIELDPSVHGPRVFDLGESPAVEAPEEEPAPIELESSVHEPKFFDLGEAPAVEAPEALPEPEPVAFEPLPEIVEPAEGVTVVEQAEPEPAAGLGYFLPELAEPEPEAEAEPEAVVPALAEEGYPVERMPLMGLSHEQMGLAREPKPEPEPEVAVPSLVEETPPIEKAPLVSLAHEPEELETSVEDEAPLIAPAPKSDELIAPPGFLGEHEEEDLGVHKPKVFDLGEAPAIEAPEEEPTSEPETIELDPSVHEPKFFDLGEAPAVEAPEEEPEPIELEPSVHEPKIFDLREVPIVEAPEEEPVPIELEPTVQEPTTVALGEVPEEEPSSETAAVETSPKPSVWDRFRRKQTTPEPVELEPAAEEPATVELGEVPEIEPLPEPVPIELEPAIEEPKVFDLGEAPAVEAPEEEPEPEPVITKGDIGVHEPRVFDLGVFPKFPAKPAPEVEEETPAVVDERVFDLAEAPEEEAEQGTPEPEEPAVVIGAGPETPEMLIESAPEEEDKPDSEEYASVPEVPEEEAEQETPEPQEPAVVIGAGPETPEMLIESVPEEETEPELDERPMAADADEAANPVYISELAETDAEEEKPQVEVPDLPVFDIETISESPEAQPAKPPVRHKARSAVPGVAVTIILLLLSTWRFINSYPPPGAVAKNFVVAIDSMMAGDTSKLSQVVSADSQQDIAQMTNIFQPFQVKRLKTQISPKEVVSRKINGDTADVVVMTDFGIPDTVQGQGKLTVTLVKEGSVIRKQWKVDLAKTGENWKIELPRLLDKSTIPER